MTTRRGFDPERSDAIRRLLIEEVEREPARRRAAATRAVVIGALAVALTATGTTAWALATGVLGDPSPSTTQTGSPLGQTPTPAGSSTSTPTPTPSTSVQIAVGTTPIQPHDVLSLPTVPVWSLTLPGSDEPCVQHSSYTVNDGLALFQSGPKIVGDIAAGCDLAHNGMTLSLVDTESGQMIWTRDWSWDSSSTGGLGNGAVLLGQSGRVLVAGHPLDDGPSEVLDLMTGGFIADFIPPADSEIQIQSTVGDSGDVVVMLTDKEPDQPFRVQRLDPRDASSPYWSTPATPRHLAGVQLVTNGLGYTSVYWSDVTNTTRHYAVLDLDNGTLNPRDEPVTYEFYTGFSIRPGDYDSSGTARTLYGLNDAGDVTWTRPTGSQSHRGEVLGSSVLPGMPTPYSGSGYRRPVGVGQFVEVSDTAVTLVDGATGETVWTADASTCGHGADAQGRDGFQGDDALLTPDGSAIDLLEYDGAGCRFDRFTGELVTHVESPASGPSVRGDKAMYAREAGEVSAYDRADGVQLWSLKEPADDLLFAGGYLIAQNGNTLRRLG